MPETHQKVSALVWTVPAKVDMVDAIDYLCEEASLDVALRINELILAGTKHLLDFPGMGRMGEIKGTRELVLTRVPYVVVYKIEGDMIAILRVIHKARKWPPESDRI